MGSGDSGSARWVPEGGRGPAAAPGEPALLLEGFRVRMYRSIRDSGTVPVFPLTALVGRHRSGKTSLLRALRALDPDLGVPFTLERDWPRAARRHSSSGHVACAATFRIGERERAALLDAGEIGPAHDRLRVGRTYGGDTLVEPCTGETSAMPRRDAAGGSPQRLASFTRAHVPRFLFGDPSSLLPGALAVDELELADPHDESGAGALALLLRELGIGPAELGAERGHARAREAAQALRELLDEQGWRHPLSLDLERGRLLVSLRSGSSRSALDEAPREARFRLTTELRLAAANRAGGRPTVLLLDGPGRAFRPEGQERMRRVLSRYVESGVTVIYTARLPFDIELQHPEQVLVLEPARQGAMVAPSAPESEDHLVLRAALGMTGRSSFRVDDVNLVVEGPSDARILEVLDGLLRRSGEPGLPPGVQLTSARGSHEVASVGAFLLHQGLRVIALLDSDAAGETARQRLESAAREGGDSQRVAVLELARAAALDSEEAAIEDLFPAPTYLAAVRQVMGREAEPLLTQAADGDADAAGNPASRLTRAFEARGRHFPKSEVIGALAERLAGAATVEELPPATAGAARRLMQAIRSAADRVGRPPLTEEVERGTRSDG